MKMGLKGAGAKFGADLLKTVITVVVIILTFIYLYAMSQPIPKDEGLGIRWDIPLWHVVVFVLTLGFILGIIITRQVMKHKKEKTEGPEKSDTPDLT